MAATGVERTLGILLAKVEGIEKSMLAAEREAHETNLAANTSRAAIHRRMDDLQGEVSDIKTDLSVVKLDVADTKRVTEDVKRWRLMGLGALGVTGIAASALTSLVAYYWDGIVRYIRG